MVAKLTLASSIKVIPLIGPVYQKLASFGILTVEDLLYYFPFRYEDLPKKSIADCVIGETITIKQPFGKSLNCAPKPANHHQGNCQRFLRGTGYLV